MLQFLTQLIVFENSSSCCRKIEIMADMVLEVWSSDFLLPSVDAKCLQFMVRSDEKSYYL